MQNLNDFGKNISSNFRETVEECETINIGQISNGVSAPVQVEINGQPVGITSTGCNYGGSRSWFICPNCSKRVGSLYRKLSNEAFLCRGCQNLTYQLRKYHRSRQENTIRQLKSLV